MTGPAVGSSSVAWLTPSGVSTSTAFGTLPGSTAQIGLLPPGAQTPNEKSPGVGVNPRAWSGENPSCPVSTTVKAQPGPGVPNSACGSPIVIVLLACDAATNAVPTELPAAFCHTGDAKPCTSTYCCQALPGAIE